MIMVRKCNRLLVIIQKKTGNWVVTGLLQRYNCPYIKNKCLFKKNRDV